MTPLPPIPFREIADAANLRAFDICNRWLPGGALRGREYVVRNPTRADKNPGSFRINVDTGAWADFALGPEARGGDMIALGAYIYGWKPVEAARAVAQIIGHPFGETEAPRKRS